MTDNPKRVPETNGPFAPRRNFLVLFWMGLGLAAFIEMIWLIVAFLRPGGRHVVSKDPHTSIEAGPVAAFVPGSVTAFPRGRFYLVRLEDGGFLALSRRCPHLGCTLPWIEAEKRFLCPCHASAFDIRGDLLRSPAPRAMAVHPVHIENEIVWVDAGQVRKRDQFETAQVVYPPTS